MIEYTEGYRYRLHETYCISTTLAPSRYVRRDINGTMLLELSPSGLLTIHAGYSWDGPSGPAIDTKNFMRGSLVHDALYELMRGGYLHQDKRKYADQLMRKVCKEDGMGSIRGWWTYWGVRIGGASAAKDVRVIHSAP